MPLDELTDEQLDQRLRELLPRSPRSRTWERAQRELLLRYITTGHTDVANDPTPATATDAHGELVELASAQPNRSRSLGWWTVGTAAAAVILVVGLLAVQRPADTPTPAQQPETTTGPTTTDRYSTVDEVLDDFDRIERTVGQLDSSRLTLSYATYFDCMATAGFDVPPEVRPTGNATLTTPEFTRDVRASVAFETAPRTAIAERGYAVAVPALVTGEMGGEPIADDPLSQWIEALSPDQQAAYAVADMGGPDAPMIEYRHDGVVAAAMPASGCNYQALQAVHGDVDAWFHATNELNALHGLIIIGALDSDAYQSAVADWATCLAAHNIQLDNPDAMTGPIDQALADRDCRDQTDLGGARNEALLTNANQQHDRMKRLVDDAGTLASADTALLATTIPGVDPQAAALQDARSQAYAIVIADALSELDLQETAAERLEDPFTGITVSAPTAGTNSVTVTFTVHLWYPGEYSDDVEFHEAVVGSTEAGVPITGGKLFVIADAATTSDHSTVAVVTPHGSITIEAAPVPGAPNPRPVADVITVSDMTDIARQLTRELPAIAAGTTN